MHAIVEPFNYTCNRPTRRMPSADYPGRKYTACRIRHPWQRTGGVNCKKFNFFVGFTHWTYLYTFIVCPKCFFIDNELPNKQSVTYFDPCQTILTRYFYWNTSRFLAGSPVYTAVSRRAKGIDHSAIYWCEGFTLCQTQITLSSDVIVIDVMTRLQCQTFPHTLGAICLLHNNHWVRTGDTVVLI